MTVSETVGSGGECEPSYSVKAAATVGFGENHENSAVIPMVKNDINVKIINSLLVFAFLLNLNISLITTVI